MTAAQANPLARSTGAAAGRRVRTDVPLILLVGAVLRQAAAASRG